MSEVRYESGLLSYLPAFLSVVDSFPPRRYIDPTFLDRSTREEKVALVAFGVQWELEEPVYYLPKIRKAVFEEGGPEELDGYERGLAALLYCDDPRAMFPEGFCADREEKIEGVFATTSLRSRNLELAIIFLGERGEFTELAGEVPEREEVVSSLSGPLRLTYLDPDRLEVRTVDLFPRPPPARVWEYVTLDNEERPVGISSFLVLSLAAFRFSPLPLPLQLEGELVAIRYANGVVISGSLSTAPEGRTYLSDSFLSREIFPEAIIDYGSFPTPLLVLPREGDQDLLFLLSTDDGPLLVCREATYLPEEGGLLLEREGRTIARPDLVFGDCLSRRGENRFLPVDFSTAPPKMVPSPEELEEARLGVFATRYAPGGEEYRRAAERYYGK